MTRAHQSCSVLARDALARDAMLYYVVLEYSMYSIWIVLTIIVQIRLWQSSLKSCLTKSFYVINRIFRLGGLKVTQIKGWTPPWQPKTKVKFRGCQHTGCWICSVVISKPPSKLYFGFKIVMIFARQPPDSLLTATWQPLENFRRLTACWQLDSFLLTACWQLVDSLTAFWQPGGVHPLLKFTVHISSTNSRLDNTACTKISCYSMPTCRVHFQWWQVAMRAHNITSPKAH